MKVLHVIPRLAIPLGGPVTAVMGMTSALKRAGVEVRLLTTDWADGIPDEIDCETKVFHCLFGSWQWSAKLGKALPEEVRWADIVNLHTLWNYPVSAAARACREAGVPYILRPCGMLDAWSLLQKRLKKQIYSALLERRTINGAAALWFTSEKERNDSRGFGFSCPGYVLPIGISRSAYETLPPVGTFKRKYPALTNSRLVLFLGRVVPNKRPDLLLRAFAKVSMEFPDTALLIIGPVEASYSQQLERLATTLGVNQCMHIIEPQQSRDVQSVMVDSEVFVLPSEHESFGISVMEAMACGLPVIVSDQVKLGADILAAEAGAVVHLDEDAIAESLRGLLSNRHLGKYMGENGRRLALGRFSWGQIVPNLVDFYDKVLAGTRTPALDARYHANEGSGVIKTKIAGTP